MFSRTTSPGVQNFFVVNTWPVAVMSPATYMISSPTSPPSFRSGVFGCPICVIQFPNVSTS